MHLHILGICGTFMGGVAALARAAGHVVTGSDENVYPPMSTQLESLGIDVTPGYGADFVTRRPDMVVVGNALSRGNAAVEALLDSRLPYCSGPEWLARHVLDDRHVMAVAGTHGKTTTASMLAWILEDAGHAPGFLIGGVPGNFEITARRGEGGYFVVEADEYDTAFFDKRAKFVHYRPRTAVINNLEFDHADIYHDLDAVLWAFHQLIRTVPGGGRLIVNAADANTKRLLDMGCWTPTETFGAGRAADWRADFGEAGRLAAAHGEARAETDWPYAGSFNLENAIAAAAAAAAAGVTLERAVAALGRFRGVRRRLERTAEVRGVSIYDDFAHHPTAIRRTIEAMRSRIDGARLVVAVEPRSNTMKLGVHNAEFARALEGADRVVVFRPSAMDPGFDTALETLGEKATSCRDYDTMVDALEALLEPGDHLVFMSNGGFGGVRQKLSERLGGEG